MTGLECSKRAAALKPEDSRSADALVEQVLAERRELPAALMNRIVSAPRRDAVNPTYVAAQIADHSSDALLSRIETCTAAKRRQFIDWLVEGERRQRGRILRRLQPFMENPAISAGSATLSDDAALPPRRVCDDAYLMARRLLAAPNEEATLKSDADFLRLPPEQRDRLILRLLASPRLASFQSQD